MSKSMTQSSDVVVTVLGGCVTAVFSDVPNLRAIIIDWDNINDSPRQSIAVSNDPTLPLSLRELPSDAALVYRLLADDAAEESV